MMLSAGDAAFRVRQAMTALAYAMKIDALSVNLTFNNIIAVADRGREQRTIVRAIVPPGINAWRIGALEMMARRVRSGDADAIAARLAQIEAKGINGRAQHRACGPEEPVGRRRASLWICGAHS
jgi:uncharacterized membrane protein YjjP (DUF1212 family)